MGIEINENEIEADNIDNDGNGYVDDIYGWNFYNNNPNIWEYIVDRNENNHGTACAGIIAANNNYIGVRGIVTSKQVKIVSLKVLI